MGFFGDRIAQQAQRQDGCWFVVIPWWVVALTIVAVRINALI